MATLEAPCAPYTPATVILGPLSFLEETDQTGTLALTLPADSGIIALSVEIEGQLVQTALPNGAPSRNDTAAVIWPDGERWGLPGAALAESGTVVQAYPLGFPARGAVVDLLTGPPAQYIDAALDGETCGKTLRADLVQGNNSARLQIDMPPCDTALGRTLRIPLED